MNPRQPYRLLLLTVGAGLALVFTAAAARGCGEAAPGCDERLDAALDHVTAVREQHLACAGDADCTTVDTGTRCQGSCPQPVNLHGIDAVRAAVAHANATWCEGFLEDRCGYATPSCAAAAAVCREGRCTLDLSP